MAYTTVERSALYMLLVLKRPVANAELEKVHKVTLGAESRKKLLADGLILVEKKGNKGNFLELTEKGREWASADIATEPQKGLKAFSAVVVYGLLNAVGAGLARRGLSLADLIDGAEDKPAPQPVTGAPIPDQIRAAYRRLAKRPREWVFLSDLRPMISGASRAEVDSALKALYSDKAIQFTSEADQKSLTAEQRSSAIRLGIADMHLISME